jgi:uncharacterized repeat protein (TIGR03803 family)
MYGTTYEGGPYLAGTVFEIAAGSQALTTLVAFGGDIGGVGPYAGVTLDASGNLYGTAYGGADGLGIVYEIAARTHVFTTLATFDGTNGKLPQSIVTLDASGNLYGTTPYGGASGDGTVFEIAAGSHTLTTLVTFDGTNGASPQAGLTLDASGNLYGTAGGGANGDGTVFEIAAGSHAFTTLATFDGTNGAAPRAGVTLDASGNLYGTTSADVSGGSVFEIAAGSHEITTLATFYGTNGAFPTAGVTLDASGNLYGTTQIGGANGAGTVFEIAASSHELTTLATFDGSNGAFPIAGLTLDASGNLFGTTYRGGANDTGTVFELSPVPEPSTFVLTGLAVAVLLVRSARGRRDITDHD